MALRNSVPPLPSLLSSPSHTPDAEQTLLEGEGERSGSVQTGVIQNLYIPKMGSDVGMCLFFPPYLKTPSKGN